MLPPAPPMFPFMLLPVPTLPVLSFTPVVVVPMFEEPVVPEFEFVMPVEAFMLLELPALALSPVPPHAPSMPAAARRDKSTKVLRIEIPPVNFRSSRANILHAKNGCLSSLEQTAAAALNILSKRCRVNRPTPPPGRFLL
jgi:hypothetical protein